VKKIFSELQERLFPEFIKIFPPVLSRVLDREPDFFQDLRHASAVLTRAFHLLKEKKIEVLSDSVISALISSNEEQY